MLAYDAVEKRKRYLQRWSALKTARSSWDTSWRELARFIRPRKSRFHSSEAASAGMTKEQAIINAAATRALKVMAAGMFAGVTSPARPWLRITTEDPGLAEWGPVKEWLDLLAKRTLAMLAKTNLYNVFHGTYEGLGWAATHCFTLEEDAKTLLRAYPHPIGEYCLATDSRGEVNTLYRTRQFTVFQAVEKFGLDAVSRRVRNAYDKGKYEETLDVLQLIEPRAVRDPEKRNGRNMPWASCWLELDCGTEKAGLLREGGFNENPIIAPRWEVLDEDVYGTGPGNEAIGDVKGLQLYERRKAQAVERIIDPPMQASRALQNLPIITRPGGLTYADPVNGAPAISPIMQINHGVVTVANDSVDRAVQRIREVFGSDLWLMISESGDPQKTAREIAERQQEKMLQLGPVMQRLDGELLTPTVTRAISVQLRRKTLPPPPPELHGQEVKLEYESIMAQAQRMITGSAVQQGAAFVTSYAQVDPEIIDKVDGDEMVTELFDALGLNPRTLRNDDQVQQRRQARAQAQAQQQATEQGAAGAQAIKALSQADLSGDNALTRTVGGIAAAQARGNV